MRGGGRNARRLERIDGALPVRVGTKVTVKIRGAGEINAHKSIFKWSETLPTCSNRM